MEAGKQCVRQDWSKTLVYPQQSVSGACPDQSPDCQELSARWLHPALLQTSTTFNLRQNGWLHFPSPWLKLQGAIWLTGVLDLLTWGDRFMASRGWVSFSSHRVVWVVRSSSLGRPCPSWYVCLLNLTVFLITTKEKQNVLKIKKHYSLLYLIFDQNSPKCYFAFYVNLALNKL